MSRRVIVTGLVLVAVAVLLSLPAPTAMRAKLTVRENVAPFQNLWSLLVHRARTAGQLLTRGEEQEERIRRGEEELVAAQLDAARWKAMAAETAEMRRLLAFRGSRRERMILCQVVARGELSGWWQTVRLDRGREVGIGPDMAVITSHGVVGKTIDAASGASDVLLLTDVNCRISCRIPRAGGFGILRGAGISRSGPGLPEMLCAPQPSVVDFIARGEPILKGYEVVTSGLGGVYPEGLLVGFVVNAGAEPSGLYQRAEILPAAGLDRLRYVFVITGTDRAEAP